MNLFPGSCYVVITRCDILIWQLPVVRGTAGAYMATLVESGTYVEEQISGIVQVGEGVKGLAHGDWVVPAVTHLGSWRTLAVWKEADLLKLPKETLPIEHAAVFRELCLAYRLLEDHGNLKVCQTAHLLLSLMHLRLRKCEM